jgi:hypothetical protein
MLSTSRKSVMGVKEIMDSILALSTFALAVFTALMARATFKLASESREASFRQIGIQTWLEFTKRFDSAETIRARVELAKRIRSYTPSENKHAKISETVLNFFEDLGTAYRLGYVDKKLASESFGFHACRWWEAAKTYVDHERRRHGEDKTLFADFEKLAGALRLPDEVIHADELSLFLTDEANLAVD